jgi:DNA-binding NarL/FixJ family response regulator
LRERLIDRITTVLLVDDHSLVRSAFRRMLEDAADLLVVGEACDGPEALEATRLLRPHVVVMDFALPGINGDVATKLILEAAPGTEILILSMHSEPSYVRASLDAGARGYLLKSAESVDLPEAVRKIALGARVIDSRIVLPHPASDADRPLTPRELEVLRCVVHGQSNNEIAAALGIQPNTVAVHRHNLMQALEVHNTASLIVKALREGIVNIDHCIAANPDRPSGL